MNVKITTVVITGATGGIGKALAIEYASPKFFLILLGRNDSALYEVVRRCELLGAQVQPYSLDLSETEAVSELSDVISQKYTIDLLISNAGITNSVKDGKVEDWIDIERLLSVNLTGAIAITHAVMQDMQRRKEGHIAYVSSLGAYYGMPLTPSYCASKAGLKAYAEAMRGLLAADSVSVSLITPGFVKTALSDQFPGSKPFMLSSQSAAKRIKKGLDKKRKVITFPLLLSFGMRLLSILPAPIADRILATLRY